MKANLQHPAEATMKSPCRLRQVLADIFWEYEHGVAEGQGDESYRARLAEATERDMAWRKVEAEEE